MRLKLKGGGGGGRGESIDRRKNEKPAVNVMHVVIAMSFGLINL